MTHFSGAMATKVFGHLVHLSEQEVVLRALYHITASVQPDKVMLIWGGGGGGEACIVCTGTCTCIMCRYVYFYKCLCYTHYLLLRAVCM